MRAWRLPRAYGKTSQQRVHAICLNGPCAFPAVPLFLRRAFSGLSGFGTSRSPAAGFQHTKWAPGRRPFCFLGFSEMSPAVPGRVKGLSPSVPGEARWGIQYQKDAARSGEPRLREAGKVMQGRENSAPPERLAGQYAFPKLTQASGFAGGPTARPGAQGKMSVSPHGAVFFKKGRG